LKKLLEDLKITSKVEWPTADKKILMSEKIDMVIQVNGKKRSIINCKKEISEDSLIKLIKDDKKLDKFIKNKKIVFTTANKDQFEIGIDSLNNKYKRDLFNK